jgi:hypothetical protein
MKPGHITAVDLLPGLNDEESHQKIKRIVRGLKKQSWIRRI